MFVSHTRWTDADSNTIIISFTTKYSCWWGDIIDRRCSNVYIFIRYCCFYGNLCWLRRNNDTDSSYSLISNLANTYSIQEELVRPTGKIWNILRAYNDWAWSCRSLDVIATNIIIILCISWLTLRLAWWCNYGSIRRDTWWWLFNCIWRGLLNVLLLIWRLLSMNWLLYDLLRWSVLTDRWFAYCFDLFIFILLKQRYQIIQRLWSFWSCLCGFIDKYAFPIGKCLIKYLWTALTWFSAITKGVSICIIRANRQTLCFELKSIVLICAWIFCSSSDDYVKYRKIIDQLFRIEAKCEIGIDFWIEVW